MVILQHGPLMNTSSSTIKYFEQIYNFFGNSYTHLYIALRHYTFRYKKKIFESLYNIPLTRKNKKYISTTVKSFDNNKFILMI